MSCCTNEHKQAHFFHPEYKNKNSEFYGKRICWFGRRVLIEDAIMSNDMKKMEYLKNFFEIKEIVTLNAQSAFRIECEKLYFKLLTDCENITFDNIVCNTTKMYASKRPDVFYKWVIDNKNFGIHLEYDETSSHEDDKERIKTIHKDADCAGSTYLIRINGMHGTDKSLCREVQNEYYKYSKITQLGIIKAEEVAELVKERINWIKGGLVPNIDRPSKIDL